MPVSDETQARESRGAVRRARRWWLMPVVLGLILAVAALLLGDFRPVVSRFYSVF